MSPGSLFHRRDKPDSENVSVSTAAAQARMASREAEKEAVTPHISPPVTSKHSPSTRDSKKHTTTCSESQLPSLDVSHKEDMANKRSAPIEDSEVPKKKPKG